MLEGVPATDKTLCYVQARVATTDDWLLLATLGEDWINQTYATRYNFDQGCNDL